MSKRPRTAIVLGSGCSLGLGVPTMPTFMDTAFDRLAKDESFESTLGALRRFTRKIKSSAAAINTRFLDVEELYGLAEMNCDLKVRKNDKGGEEEELLKHFRRTLMYMCVDAGAELIKDIEYRQIAQHIERVKRESQSEDPELFTDRGARHANLLAYLGLASFKDAENKTYPLVIQFNWDLAFDRALYACFILAKCKNGEKVSECNSFPEPCRVGWAQYGVDEEHDFGKYPLVMRPHGGLHFQWLTIDGENRILEDPEKKPQESWEKRKLFDKGGEECQGLYLYEQAITKWLKLPDKSCLSNELFEHVLRRGDAMAIEPPTWKKDVTRFLHQWQLMRKYMESVRRIVFIGYSLPRSDLYMRHFLALAQAEAHYVPQVTVWNPEMRPGTDTWDNYGEVFAPLRRQGRLYALPQRFGDPALFDLERALHLAEPVT